MLIRKFNEHCAQVRSVKHPTPIPESPVSSDDRDLSSTATASLWVTLSMIKYSWNPSEWITVKATSRSSIEAAGLKVMVVADGQYDTYSNSDPLRRNVTETLGGAGIEKPLRTVTGIVAETPGGTMRCQLHQTSTRFELIFACEFPER